MVRPNSRDSARHPKRLRFRFRNRGEAKWQIAFTRNVSRTGVYLISGKIPADEPIELELELGTETMLLEAQLIRGLKSTAQMRRLAKGGFGVRILKAPPSWTKYCDELDLK